MASHDFNFTDSGYVPGDLDFNFGTEINVYNILKGLSNNFSSIWVCGNKMYVASEGYLTVVALADNSVYDWYSNSYVGRANESLDSEDVIDINVT